MKLGYDKTELEIAMDAMWKALLVYAPRQELDRLKNEHRSIDEIDDFGPNGPVGLGLGCYGGNCSGE